MINKRDLERFNVFLIVHIDYYQPDGASDRPKDISKIYANIKFLEDYCKSTRKKFFVTRIYTLNDCIKKLNLISDYLVLENPKEIISSISQISKIPIDKLNIGFGGFKWDACVRDWYINLVENPLTFNRNFIENWRKQPSILKENPKAKFGEIILDLTDFNCKK